MAEDLESMCQKLSLREDEEEVLLLPGAQDDDGTFQGDLCILGKLLTRKSFNGEAMMATMRKAWNPSNGLTHIAIGDNFFLFQFNDLLDKKKPLTGGPWAFDVNLLVFGDYISHIQPTKVKLDVCSFWVRAYNVPLGWMNAKTAEFIGDTLGEYEGFEGNSDQLAWGKFLRIRVKLHVDKPLKRQMKLYIEGEVCRIQFRYERLPLYCYSCGRLGHNERDCDLKLNSDNLGTGEPQYPAWLKVGNVKQQFSGQQQASKARALVGKESQPYPAAAQSLIGEESSLGRTMANHVSRNDTLDTNPVPPHLWAHTNSRWILIAEKSTDLQALRSIASSVGQKRRKTIRKSLRSHPSQASGDSSLFGHAAQRSRKHTRPTDMVFEVAGDSKRCKMAVLATVTATTDETAETGAQSRREP
ncbi:uncharacterized protein LOC113766106 [Coffea eugenioides]|uniref:uncharacterized protein LOC113766106 n=1 Tax=Coffea eugenioides TaxID=49369 RepID=UPI000F609C13|nr:uncharacterized protein LOC113766106 [Coffea eugenioides]